MIHRLIVAAGMLLSLSCYGADRPAPSRKPELTIERVNATRSIDVTLSPNPSGATRIWKQSNSWGAANWRVLIVRENGLFLFREDPDQRFSMNGPGFIDLRDPKKFSLNLESNLWIGPKADLGAFRSGDRVVVVYDVPVTVEASQYGVWYGTISAMSVVN